jgi:hypothetical protein
MGISIRHNSVAEAAQYLRVRPEQVVAMMQRGEIEVLRLGGVDYVALEVITEGRAPRRYQPHPPGQPLAPPMPRPPRSRPKRRR